MPPGVSVSLPTGTGALLDRAARRQAARASSDQPIAAGATAPLGTPGIATLAHHVAPSCSGTGRDGNRVQVLYVHEAGTASRFTSVRPILQDEVANVDDVFAVSARQTGGERRVRWVHDHCLPVIKDVTVPRGALGADFFATVQALKSLGYNAANRKYLAFADANRLCGIATMYDDPRRTGNVNDGTYASYARVDVNCWTSGHSVAAHELTHTLGGVQESAPHATLHGHCYDDSDLMCYDDGSGIAMRKVCASAQEQLLDCNHDDYFSTAPAAGSFLAKNWNTAGSSFLDVVARPWPAPTAVVAAPTAGAAGRAFTVSVTATGRAPFTYAWQAGTCRVSPATAASASVTCPARSATRSEVVAVVVRAADGRTVRVERLVRLMGTSL
jgi:hypothetical protein